MWLTLLLPKQYPLQRKKISFWWSPINWLFWDEIKLFNSLILSRLTCKLCEIVPEQLYSREKFAPLLRQYLSEYSNHDLWGSSLTHENIDYFWPSVSSKDCSLCLLLGWLGWGSLSLTSFFTCMHWSVISSTLQVNFLQISGVLYAALSSLVSCPENSSCLSSFIPAPSQVSIITRLYLILPLGAASQKLSSRNKLGQS